MISIVVGVRVLLLFLFSVLVCGLSCFLVSCLCHLLGFL